MHAQPKTQIDNALRNGVLSEVYRASRRFARVYYSSSTKVLLVKEKKKKMEKP